MLLDRYIIHTYIVDIWLLDMLTIKYREHYSTYLPSSIVNIVWHTRHQVLWALFDMLAIEYYEYYLIYLSLSIVSIAWHACYDPASHKRLLRNLSFILYQSRYIKTRARHTLMLSTRWTYIECTVNLYRAYSELASNTNIINYIVYTISP